MIEVKKNLFHLYSKEVSYLFRVTANGQLEHLHFGSPIAAEDAAALSCKPGLGWGCSTVYNEEDSSCLDVLPLEWSGCGRGDYRESPLVLADEQPTDFRYVGHELLQAPVKTGAPLPQAQGKGEALMITMEGCGLRLRLYWTLYGSVIVRRAVVENTGSTSVTLQKIMSTCVDLQGSFEMMTLDGGWIAEAHPHSTPVGAARVVNESVTGFSSNRHNPGFLLSEQDATETSGRVYGFNLIYSGNHYASAQRSLQGLTRVMQGISPEGFCKALLPNQVFETPEAVLAFSDLGFGGLSRQMHRFVNQHIIPPPWQNRPRPVLYNSWEGCMFDFTQGRLLGLAKTAKKLGCELFVLDDGWFGKRNDDHAGLGDYNVNRKKLPEGLSGLAEKLEAMGLQFGLWFEPEAVNPDSDLFRAHPDWVLPGDGLPPIYGRHELLLDLSRKEVQDYIVASVSSILDSAKISYVKWDMNRHSTALGAKAHDYILGLYQVLRRIFEPRPEILLESCASGGNRFDLGMLCFSPQIWCSDNTDPIERLDIQKGLSYLYPLSTMGAHVSAAPHSQTLRSTPLSTRGNLSFFGLLGYELDLKYLLPVESQEIASQIAFYKQHREVFQFGEFRRLFLQEDGEAWQVSQGKTHIAGVFHRLVHAAPPYEQLRLQGLAPGKRYRVTSRPQLLRIGDFGALVRHISPVALNPNGIVLRTADRHYTLPEGNECYLATGNALMAGLNLASRFSGTGYDQALRMQGDLGSSIYLIEEVSNHEKSTNTDQE